jgi:predicted phosphodiesterase
MKLLLFSDLHADATAARRLIERAQTADVLVGAGDLGNVRVCIDVLRPVGKPAVLVAGNNESTKGRGLLQQLGGEVVGVGAGVEVVGGADGREGQAEQGQQERQQGGAEGDLHAPILPQAAHPLQRIARRPGTEGRRERPG